MQMTDTCSTCFRPLQLSSSLFQHKRYIAASVLLLSKRSFYVLSLDIIFVPFASAVLMLERPFFDGG